MIDKQMALWIGSLIRSVLQAPFRRSIHPSSLQPTPPERQSPPKAEERPEESSGPPHYPFSGLERLIEIQWGLTPDDSAYIAALSELAGAAALALAPNERVMEGEDAEDAISRLRIHTAEWVSRLRAAGSYSGAQLPPARRTTRMRLAEEVANRLQQKSEAVYQRLRCEEQQRKADEGLLNFTRFQNHELRGLMQQLVAQIETSTHLDGAEQKNMSECIDSVLDIMNNSLLIQSMSAGHYEVAPKPTQLSALLETMQIRFKALCSQRELRFNWEAPACDSTWLFLDREALLRCATNYVSNALKFTETSICVKVELTDDTLWIHVADDGPGLAPAELETVWLPFKQTPAGQAQGKEGTGLGLPITRGTIEAHPGGAVDACSIPGAGSTFSLRLDANPAPQQSPPAPRLQVVKARTRVLVVDDSQAIRLSTALLLKKIGGQLEAVTVASGEAAIKEILSHEPGHYSAALVDYDMGADMLDGTTTVRGLMKVDPNLRCIGATGSGNDLDVQIAYQKAGALGTCTKPYGVNELRLLLTADNASMDGENPAEEHWLVTHRNTVAELELDSSILDECLSSLAEDVAILSKNLNNWRVAHKLKGDALLLSLTPLAKIVDILEREGRMGSDCTHHEEALRNAWEEVTSELI